MIRKTMRPMLAAGLVLASGAAAAHTGHEHGSLMQGLAHPLGADHLLAMLAVGLWSARALPAGRRALGPLVFVLAMLAGAGAGLAGLVPAGLELGIALSVVAFGALLLAGHRLPTPAGLGAIAVGAGLHGVAHGAELAAGLPFAAYAIGFVTTTALLHTAGLLAGDAAERLRHGALRWAGALIGGLGLVLLTQV